jgi:acyl-CoA synthetase (AMP-forming)/AMP-acid ligase II
VLPISWVEIDHVGDAVCRNALQKTTGRVAVRIDEAEAIAGGDFFLGHSGKQAGFASAAHSYQVDVPPAVTRRYVNLPLGQVDGVTDVHELRSARGRNVSPSDVELAVEKLPFTGPGRCVLFGVDDARTGVQSQVLLVECREAPAPEIVSERLIVLRRLVLDQFGFTPSDIRFVPQGTVEKTSSGKKRTAVIRARYLTGELPSPAGPISHHA